MTKITCGIIADKIAIKQFFKNVLESSYKLPFLPLSTMKKNHTE